MILQSDKMLGADIIQTYTKYKQDIQNYKQNKVKDSGEKQFEFLLPKKYQTLQILGKGSYGIVCAALDKLPQNKQKQSPLYAIKKIQKPFEHKILTRRMVRQLHLLKLLSHQNIIKIQTLLMPISREKFKYIYIVFEFMDTDLHQVLKSDQKLSKQHFQFFLYQIVRGLKYLHSADIVHRDLKPRNLLINKNCDLKICDFGLARSLKHKSKTNQLTDYVATRWYRAPQLLIGSTQYDAAVDIWSVGCIFAEMLQRKAFMKGKSTVQQVQIIIDMIGIEGVDNVQAFSDSGKRMIKKLAKGKGIGQLHKLFSKYGQLEIDLLKKLLALDPKKRLTAAEALKHPFFAQLHVQTDEPVIKPFPSCDFEFEEHKLTTQQLKDILYEEILTYNYPQFAKQYEEKRSKNQSFISHILANSNKTNNDPVADQSDQQQQR